MYKTYVYTIFVKTLNIANPHSLRKIYQNIQYITTQKVICEFLVICSCEVYSFSRAGPVRSPMLSVLVFHPVSRGDGAVDGAVREKRVMASKIG